MPKGGDGMPARKKEPEDLTAKKELALPYAVMDSQGKLQ